MLGGRSAERTLSVQDELDAAQNAIGEAVDALSKVTGPVRVWYEARCEDESLPEASMEAIGALYMFSRRVDSYLKEAREMMLDPLVDELWHL